MKIALTGGLGFIGKWLIKALSEHHNCLILSRKMMKNDMDLGGADCEYAATDYSREQLKVQLKGVDALVHLAAKRHQTGATMVEYLPNIEISSNLLEVCRGLGVGNIVHLSTIGVYGNDRNIPWKETQDTAPMTYYGVSKVAVEKLGNAYNMRYGMSIKNLRVAQVLGVGEREGYMLSTFINKASKKECLEIWGRGEGARDYIYIKDVVRAIGRALQQPEKRGVFNIGSNRSTTHFELAEIVNRAFENAGNLKRLKEKKEDNSVYQMNSDKAMSELLWEPEWPLLEAMLDIRKTKSKM